VKIYAPADGFTKAEMDRGLWALYVDVKCTGCGFEIAASYVNGIGGPCPKCWEPCR